MKAVIFDMDGVLINTEPLHYRCWKEILKEKNGIDLDYEVYLPCIGSTRGFFMDLINENYGPVFEDVDKMNALMKEKKAQITEAVKRRRISACSSVFLSGLCDQRCIKVAGYGEIFYSSHEWGLCRTSKTGTGYLSCNGRETGNEAGGLSGSRGFDQRWRSCQGSRYEMYLVPQPGFRKAGYLGCGTGISGMDQRKCRKNAENIRKRGRVKMRIRTADLSDLKEIARVEAECFPAAEAATEEEFEKRLTFYKDHFWLMFEEEKLIAFVDGMVTNQEDLTDEMYEKAEMHDEKGEWQMIFGVNTLPSYRKHGYAGELIKRAIADAKEQGRKGLVLTCKDRLISYYARFGFKNEGVSESVHGNVVWNQMRLTFDEGLGE